jgi:hypothetical protein
MYTSAIFGIPPVMCMFPDDIERRLAVGYPNGEPPLLMARAGTRAINGSVLPSGLETILSEPERWRQRTLENGAVFRKLLEPGAEERIAEVVKRCM